MADIKKSAKNGQMGACKIQAKDLVRTRRWVSVLWIGDQGGHFEVEELLK